MPANIILILTDDQRADEWQFMPVLKKQIIDRGVSLPNFYATTSLCTPSRVSLLRGQYAHNTHIVGNGPPYGGWSKFYDSGLEQSTVATWLQAAGYQTGIFGKYVNEYESAPAGYVAPGWDRWFVTYGQQNFFNYEINDNGVVALGGGSEADYQPSVVASAAVSWIDSLLSTNPSAPFFAFINPRAPHSDDDGAPAPYLPQYESYFTTEIAPRTPAFNEEDVSDKPGNIQAKPLLTIEEIDGLDIHRRARLRSLQTVDEMIKSIIHMLAAYQQLPNTYIFVASDNGTFLGEHRLHPSKNLPYQPAIRTSAFVKGPGIPWNSTVANLTANIDLAPTFAKIAGIIPPGFVDGRSILPLLKGIDPTFARKALCLENYRQGTEITDDILISGFLTEEYKYLQHYTAARELYDLTLDPDEAENVAALFDLTAYSNYLSQLNTGAGSTGWQLENSPPAKFEPIT